MNGALEGRFFRPIARPLGVAHRASWKRRPVTSERRLISTSPWAVAECVC